MCKYTKNRSIIKSYTNFKLFRAISYSFALQYGVLNYVLVLNWRETSTECKRNEQKNTILQNFFQN